jgi:translation initiation factor 5B
MAPKNKGKKTKKDGDDDYWEKAGVSVANNNVAVAGDVSDDEPVTKSKGGGFAALMMDAGEEEEEDFGGLMVCLNAQDYIHSIYLVCDQS